MPDHDRPGYSFDPGPPPEASRFLANKGLTPSFSWRDVEPEEHATAFTVAKAMQADVLQDIRDGVQAALDEGKTFAQFKRELRPLLEEKGWWGRREMTDPLTGETRIVQLGSPRRLRTIYRANLRSARAAGQWERIQRTQHALPYLLYQLGPSERHRPHHEDKEGLVLPADDPFWRTWFPPNGWGCKCWVRQITSREAAQRGPSDSPDVPTRRVRNRRTGEVRDVPDGIDVGWDRNPGQMRQEAMAQMLRDKLVAMAPDGRRVVLRDTATSWAVGRIARREVPGRVPIGVLPGRVAEAAGTGRVVDFTDRTAQHLFVEKADRALADLDLAASLERARFAIRTDPQGRRSLHALVEADDGRIARFVAFWDETGPYLTTLFRSRLARWRRQVEENDEFELLE